MTSSNSLMTKCSAEQAENPQISYQVTQKPLADRRPPGRIQTPDPQSRVTRDAKRSYDRAAPRGHFARRQIPASHPIGNRRPTGRGQVAPRVLTSAGVDRVHLHGGQRHRQNSHGVGAFWDSDVASRIGLWSEMGPGNSALPASVCRIGARRHPASQRRRSEASVLRTIGRRRAHAQEARLKEPCQCSQPTFIGNPSRIRLFPHHAQTGCGKWRKSMTANEDGIISWDRLTPAEKRLSGRRCDGWN